jgi:hypothetical protein
VVAVEQGHEAGLGSRRALHAAGLELFQAMFRLVQVQRQVVGPQASSFADRGGLGGLQMGEPQASQVAVLDGKLRQRVDHARQPAANQLQRLAKQDQVGVVGDVATGGA